MDESRFDDLARALSVGPSRRSLLVTLGATMLGAVLSARANDVIAKHKKPKCKSTEKKCGKQCIPKANCCSDRDCVGAATCRKGKCRCKPQCAGKSCGAKDGCGGFCTACPQGKSCVNKQCVDDVCNPKCDGKNCGDDDGCGGTCIVQQGCSGNRVCVNGNCVCPGALPTLCQGHCTNPLTDKTNCSRFVEICGFACSPPDDKDWECCNGDCAFLPGCLAGAGGWIECQKANCGGCGQPCLDEGHGCCEGHCVNMVEGLDANGNCGFCGASCGDLTCCGSRCVNTDNDPLNCGDCGNACEGTHACCHGECTRLGTPENCRGCDDECEGNQVCVNSAIGCASP